MSSLSHLPSRPIPELLQHAGLNFGFLVARGERISLREFASRIKEGYSAENPKTAEVLRALHKAPYGAVGKDHVSAMLSVWLPDMSKLANYAYPLIRMLESNKDICGFAWGDTTGADGNFGREHLDDLADRGLLERTGGSVQNGLGGSWPEVRITPLGKAVAQAAREKLLSTPVSPIQDGAEARLLAEQLPLAMNVYGKFPHCKELAGATQEISISDGTRDEIQQLVNTAWERMLCFGYKSNQEDWKDARRLAVWVDGMRERQDDDLNQGDEHSSASSMRP